MNWECYLYQYIVGGLIFFVGFVLAWRSGDHSWKRREDRRTTIFMLVTFLFYLTGHGLWHFYASGGF